MNIAGYSGALCQRPSFLSFVKMFGQPLCRCRVVLQRIHQSRIGESANVAPPILAKPFPNLRCSANFEIFLQQNRLTWLDENMFQVKAGGIREVLRQVAHNW
jgi:hypothetical protein